MILFFVALRLAFVLIISIASIFASILLAKYLYQLAFKHKDRNILKSLVCYLIGLNIPIFIICYLLRVGQLYNATLIDLPKAYLIKITSILIIIYGVLNLSICDKQKTLEIDR